MMGPCWAVNPKRKNGTFVIEESDVDATIEFSETTKRKSEPVKNLTPEEQAKIAASRQMTA